MGREAAGVTEKAPRPATALACQVMLNEARRQRGNAVKGGHSKLSPADKLEIWKSNLLPRRLAEKYGISLAYVYQIKREFEAKLVQPETRVTE